MPQYNASVLILEIMMNLALAFLLQVAGLLLASANGGAQVNDAVFQQAFLEGKASLQTNETNSESDSEEDDLLSALIQLDDDEIAHEQIDRLSLVTWYTGTGYNII